MAIKLVGNISNVGMDTDGYADAARVSIVPRAGGYSAYGITGTLSAAMGANGCVWSMYLDPGSSVRAFVEQICVQWTTIVAFTTPVTAGRRLELYRGAGSSTSGGSGIAAAAPKHTALGASQFDAAEGGDIRISTVAALTSGGITYENTAFAGMTLSNVGTAGAYKEQIWEFAAAKNCPIILEPGQLLAIRNTQAMDAAGTWLLGVRADWYEAAAF